MASHRLSIAVSIEGTSILTGSEAAEGLIVVGG